MEKAMAVRTYWISWGTLLILTMIMLLLEKSGFPRVAAVLFLVMAMLIKATVIGGWFMHLRYERVALVAAVVGAVLATAAVLFFLIIPDAVNVLRSSTQ
jgi:cytochrome c oxidase subunit IV